MHRVVETALGIFADPINVRLGGLHEVDRGHIGDSLALGMQHHVERHVHLLELSDFEQRGDDVPAVLVIDKHLPAPVALGRLVPLRPSTARVQAKHLADRLPLAVLHRKPRRHGRLLGWALGQPLPEQEASFFRRLGRRSAPGAVDV